MKSPRESAKDLLCLAGILGFTFLVFAGSLDGAFVYDDNRQIVRNPLIQNPTLTWEALTSDVWAFKGDGTTAASNYWRPTFTAWNIANFPLFGLNPFGWHLSSLLLHLAVCATLYLLLRLWGQSILQSSLCAVLFAVHPVHTEAVAWVAGSPDLLFSLFLLAALSLTTLHAESGRRPVLVAALLLYGLALGAKEVALLCFPLFWWVYRWNARASDTGCASPSARALRSTLPFALLASAYFFARWGVLGQLSHPNPEVTSPLTALLTVPSAFLFYLKQLLLPLSLGPSYALRPVSEPGMVAFWLPLAVSVSIGFGLLRLARRSAIQTVGLALFVLPLAPAFNITAFPSEQIVHDRYLYLPLLGFLLLVLPALENLADRIMEKRRARAVLIGATVMAAIALGMRTHSYIPVWADDITLWEHGTEIDGSSSFNWSQYGAALATGSRHREAIEAYDRALASRPHARALLGRGRSLLELGQAQRALPDLLAVSKTENEAIDAYALYQAYEALAIAYSSVERPALAGAALLDARRRLPIYHAALTEKLAIVLYQDGRKAEALRALLGARARARVELLPESKAVFLRLGMLYAERGQKSEARESLQEYLGLTGALEDEFTLEDRETAKALLRQLAF